MTTKAVDLAGQKFGSLTVLERAGCSPHGCARWLCRCDCGNITMVTTGNLVNRHSKSCGCLKTKAQQAMRQPSNERTPSGLHIKIPAAGQRTIKQAEKLPRRQAVEALAKVCRVVRHIA